MPRFTISIALLLATVPAFVTGCGGSKSAPMPDYGSEEGLKIAQLVSEFNEAKADANKFRKMFAGTAPSNWREYERSVYEVVVGSPKVNGSTATAGVTIRKEANYEVVATTEWTFARVGDTWKIKSAP